MPWPAWRARYRRATAFLLDDVHLIARQGPDPGRAVRPLQRAHRRGAPARLHLRRAAGGALGRRGAAPLAPRGRARRRAAGARRGGAPSACSSASSRPSSAPPTPSSRRTSPPGPRTRSAPPRRCCSACSRPPRARACRRAPPSRASCWRSPAAAAAANRAAAAASPVERRGRRGRRRHAQPREDGVGMARGGAIASSRSGADGDQGKPQGGEPPRRDPAALPRAADRVPGAGRPAQLRHDLLRGRPHRLRRDREPARPAGRHPAQERAHQRRSSCSRRSTAQEGDREHKLGEILVELGALKREELESYMRLQIEEAVYYLFTWTSGTFNFEAGVRPEQRGFPRPHQPRVPAARGRPAGGRVEPDREEDPLVRPDLRGGSGAHRRVGARALGRAAAPGPAARRHARRPGGHRGVRPGGVRGRQGAVRPDHGRLRPPGRHLGRGRAQGQRRPGRGAPEPGHRLLQGGHAGRGAARVPPGGRPPAHRRQRAVLPRAHRRCGRAAGTRPRPASGRRPTAAGAKPAALHNLGYALERLGRLDEAEAAFGDAAGRARDDARIMLGWSVVALKRGEHQVAQGRLARALELLGAKPAPALWYWAATLASAGLDDGAGALRAARAGVGAFPANAVLQNNLAVLLEQTGDVAARRDGAPRRAGRGSRRCRRSPRTWPTSSTATAATRRRARPTSARPSSPRIWATTCTSSSGTSPTSGATSRWRARAGAGPPTLNPGHELARANLEMLDMAP